MTDLPRDRLRQLLDAVLGSDHRSLGDMASGAHSSPHHFTRQLSRHAGESPVALRRRVELERAGWHLQRGRSVTEAAFDAGYESVEGFARAFTRAYGHPPSQLPPPTERGHWLAAPNGIHFHSPTALYVEGDQVSEYAAGDVVALLTRHDVDDVTALLDAAKSLDDDSFREVRLANSSSLPWAGPDESLSDVMRHLVLSKEPWLASIEGRDAPDLDRPHDVGALIELHHEISPRWLALTREIERRGAWQDSIVDAICDPPESFLLSQIVAHELTFSAHRRQLARWMLRAAGVETSADLDPDPITWHRRHTGAHDE